MIRIRQLITWLALLSLMGFYVSATFQPSSSVFALGRDLSLSKNHDSQELVSIPTATSTPMPIPTQTLIPTPIDNVSYEKIASQAIQSSTHTLEQMKWILGIMSTVLLAIAGGIVGYFMRTQQDLINSNKTMREKINESDQKYEAATHQLNSLSSNFLQLLYELNYQSTIFLPPDMAMKAIEEGKISQDQYRETQIWFAWANWYYGGSEQSYLQLLNYKDTPQSLPISIRRIMILEVEQINNRKKSRGMLFTSEKELLVKILGLLGLSLENPIEN